ncbi:hypothetical protein [Lactobacillus johnsonii]|uniref:hypothetical protein n=1 Tax=Lactobacillus johnsonii TaxID=33959 RepID=UPI002B25E339|nr:hypothetical protein [Lactobacillus johnsonii]
MSEYNKTILTNEGIDLARRANKGTATFSLTRGVSSTDNLSGKTVEELQNLTKLPSIQQSVILSDVVNTTDNPDTVLGIRMTFDNQNLKTGYNVHTVGIYAKEPGKNEILYGVATAKTPEYIPDFGEQTLFKFDFLMYLVIGRTDKVTVEVSPDDVYRKRDTYNKTEIDAKVSDAVSKLNNKDAEILKSLNDYKQEDKTYHQNLEQQINRNLDTKADKSTVNQQLGTKADKSTTYTKDEVDNRISPKADKSYVDGELSKRADKATTYTKDEVNNKIAGQVKSVNGHRADNNGEVTLPKLKATTLIAYDVPNKRPTFDDNAGFDGNGNFSRWPVDQGVIGQLADAINAKLPIEAGDPNGDLLDHAGNKIEYWNGNGQNVKNLPPMSNKRWYFAIRLVGPGGWGSVTVVDQDGTYWLNTRNDVWTGWRSVTTNETLKKLKFVKQSVNQNGDTFQDTKFVTQEADGTFKINIYDSDWTASKVSWLLKNTQSYNIAANTNLNNIKAPGLYHCSGASNIANVPDGMDSWFNMVVNSDNWNGSQAFYAINHNQLYIRTWNSSGFKQWHRVINDDDYNNLSSSKADKANTYTRNEIESKLSGKANTSDVNARLPLSGGSMTKGSYVMWNTESPYNAHDGDIGGLYWNAASDSIKIFGDNNGPDNLDLAIQLGDDNSNHISIRDKDGVERAAITADGHFTGGTDWARVGGTGLNNPTLGRYIQHSNTWNDIIGQNNGQMALTAIRDDSNGSENTIGQHSAGVAFGGGDTKGVLSVAWNEPHARIIGGNGNSPTWKKDIAWKDDINNANPSVTVINSFDVANVQEGPHQTWPVKQPWLVDQMALHPFADAINALNTNLSTLRTELMNLKRRVDYNSPQGEFNNTTVNINDLRSTGIYRFANCYIQNGPYPTNNTHWIYLQVTVFDANTVYQTLYEGDNMYGRKSSSPTNWGKWHKYLNQEV